MGISACSVALLLGCLGFLIDLSANSSKSGIELGQRLTVHLRKNEGKPNFEVTTANQAVPSSWLEEIDLAEHADLQHEAITDRSAESPPDSRPLEEWHAITKQAARASVDELFRSEKSRASMWRQSYSTMFLADGALVVKDEEPIIQNFGFRPEIHVIGLGLTIGPCFIGIPLAGVPVEDRTVGVSLFTCAKKS